MRGTLQDLVGMALPRYLVEHERAAATAALCALTLVSFLPAWQAGFVWDDTIFTELPAVQEADGIWKLWFQPREAYLNPGGHGEGHYWPLTYSTFWLEHKLWGSEPMPYHVANVLLHLVNVLLLWRVLLLLGLPWAWLGAAIFAVHPLHVESVVWAIARKDVLSGACYLGACLVWLRHQREPRPGRYMAALLLFAAGLLSKSIVVTLPVAMLLWHWWAKGRVTRSDVVGVVPFFLVGFAITLGDMKFYQSMEVLSLDYSAIDRILIASHAAWFYVGKILWPARLDVIYALWDPARLLEWVYLVAAAGLIAGLWLMRGRIGRGPLFGVLYFGATVAPTLGFVDYGYMQFSFVADRYQYLAGIGLIALVAAGAERCVCLLPKNRRRAGLGALLLALIALGTLTWQQSRIYENQVVFFSHVVARNPTARGAQSNLAAGLAEEERLEEALGPARLAVQQYSDHWGPNQILGKINLDLGRLDEAERYLRRAVELKPKDADTLQSLAEARRRAGNCADAIVLYRRVLEKQSETNSLARAGLGTCLFETGEFEQSVLTLREALEEDPTQLEEQPYISFVLGWALHESGHPEEGWARMSHPPAGDPAENLFNLGERYRERKHYQLSLAPYRMSLELEPNRFGSHVGLGDALFRLERYEEAMASMQRGIDLQPSAPSPSVHFVAGEIAMAMNRPQGAERHYQDALKVDPGYGPALRAVGATRFQRQDYEGALEYFQRLVGSQPTDAQAHSDVGATLFMLERVEEALAMFERALEIDPGSETARNNRDAARALLAGRRR